MLAVTAPCRQLEKHFSPLGIAFTIKSNLSQHKPMKFPILVFFLGITFLGSAFGKTVDLTAQNAGRDLIINRGDFLTVHLPTNPSTGYSWRVAFSVSGILTPDQSREIQYPPQKQGEMLVGALGTQVWSFQATRSGKTKILFVYGRPWERGVAPARKIAWPVSVRE